MVMCIYREYCSDKAIPYFSAMVRQAHHDIWGIGRHHGLGCIALNAFAEGVLLAVPDKYPEQQGHEVLYQLLHKVFITFTGTLYPLFIAVLKSLHGD